MYFLYLERIKNIKIYLEKEVSCDMYNLPDLFSNQNLLAVEEAKQEIRICNELSEQFGLSLSEAEIEELVQCRSDALKNSGRILLL